MTKSYKHFSIIQLEELLAVYRANLYQLEIDAAGHGSASSVPISIKNQIDSTIVNIDSIQREIDIKKEYIDELTRVKASLALMTEEKERIEIEYINEKIAHSLQGDFHAYLGFNTTPADAAALLEKFASSINEAIAATFIDDFDIISDGPINISNFTRSVLSSLMNEFIIHEKRKETVIKILKDAFDKHVEK